MSARYDKLLGLLKNLFQLNRPELDFGLYRIMHARSAEVSKFLDEDLLPQVEEAFAVYRSADKADLEKELEQVIAGVEAAGMDPEGSPKVNELRTRLEDDAVDVSALEGEVYDHLYRFFRRYYSEGDFLSKRVYKPDVYAIPYEGEEVKLHWANADQYYTKTSEYLRDYAFRLRPESEDDPMRVHFRLVDAAEGEHGNVKEAKDRVFILAVAGESGHDFVAEEDGDAGSELVVRFEYRPATMEDWPPERREEEQERLKNPKPPKQADLDAMAAERLLGLSHPDLSRWLEELSRPHVLASGEEANYTRLEAHLRRYNARNTFDYFIHKDLGGFLRRELDFYIKNEVMHLDDIENESVPRVEQYLSKIKVIRRIAGKIIDFLAQLENFQKKLWLKKKFVVETSWCIRVGCIPEEFYPEIAANEAQREEWIALHRVDELQGEQGGVTRPPYSKPLTAEFVAEHETLMVDTCHFNNDFVGRLMAALGSLSHHTDGLLIHSENFQALSAMQALMRESVECIYIDPPYNTELDRAEGRFLYKDNYEHSTWLTMMHDRLALDERLLSPTGAHFTSSDESELHRLIALTERFGRTYHGLLTWRRTRTGGHLSTSFNQLSDYLVVTTAPGGKYLYGGMADPDESQPLSKATNNIKTLRFPPGALGFRDRSDGVIPKNYSGSAKKPVRALTPIRVSNGKNAETVVLEGPFIWTQGKLEQELASGASIIIKRWKNLNLRFFREPTRHKPFPSLADGSFDVGTNEDGSAVIEALFRQGDKVSYPKPVKLLERIVSSKTYFEDGKSVLDYFAGSGTTGHAVINLNREDGGQRRFILVEMGEYFDTVLLPRLKKVTFTPEWKDGRPKRLATREEAERSPRIMKVVRLESYEDALNNLEIRRTDAQQDFLDQAAARGPDGFREDYMLRYMLDVETRGSQSLLNIQQFADPTAYRLKIKRPGSDESREVAVDLIDTFNCLIGLRVEKLAAPATYRASFEPDAEGRLRVEGALEQNPDGPHWFRTVTGTLPDGRRALVIWRKLTGAPEEDNLVLNEWFREQNHAGGERPFDLVYVNGGNNLENLRDPDETWSARLIEEDFHRLMFEAEAS